MVVPVLDDIVDFVGFTSVEVDVVVGFAEKLALNGSLKLVFGQAQQVSLLLGGLHFVISYFVDVMPYEVSLRLSFDLIVVEWLHLHIIPFVDKPSFLCRGGGCLLAGSLHFLHFLNRSDIVIHIQALVNVALGLTGLGNFCVIQILQRCLTGEY